MFYHVITHNPAAAENLGPLPKYADTETQSFVWRTGHWTASDRALEPTVVGSPEIIQHARTILALLDVDALAVARCVAATHRFRSWYIHRKVGHTEQVKMVRDGNRILYKYSCIADAIPSHAYFEHELEIPLKQTTEDRGELYLCHMLTR